MSECLSQNDLVKEMLNKISETDQEVTDKINLPGLDTLFTKPPNSKKEKETTVQLSILKKPYTLEKTELAKALVDIVSNFSGISELSWHIEKPLINVKFAEGWIQKRPETDISVDLLEDIFLIILKLRAKTRGFCWKLGMPFVEITYLGL